MIYIYIHILKLYIIYIYIYQVLQLPLSFWNTHESMCVSIFVEDSTRFLRGAVALPGLSPTKPGTAPAPAQGVRRLEMVVICCDDRWVTWG